MIEDVLDGVISEESAETEAGPSEMTMKRWRSWYQKNVQRILGYIRAARHRSYGSAAETGSGESLLARLRLEGQGWLSAVCVIVYNTGGFLAPDSS